MATFQARGVKAASDTGLNDSCLAVERTDHMSMTKITPAETSPRGVGRRMQERRTKRRFAFRQQVVFKLREAGKWSEFQGITENVSELGVLMLIDSSVPAPVDADVTVEIQDGNLPVRLSCVGKVVRVEPSVETGKSVVAVRCNRSLTMSKAKASGHE